MNETNAIKSLLSFTISCAQGHKTFLYAAYNMLSLLTFLVLKVEVKIMQYYKELVKSLTVSEPVSNP